MNYNITRQHKKTNKIEVLDYLKKNWLQISSTVCRAVMTETDAEFYINAIANEKEIYYYFKTVNAELKRKCKICFYGDNTGNNADLDSDLHKGFTVKNGKKLYWGMLWHSSGHVSVITKSGGRRWIDGGTEITIHFK